MKLNVQNEDGYPLFKVGRLGFLQVNTMHYIPHHFLDKRVRLENCFILNSHDLQGLPESRWCHTWGRRQPKHRLLSPQKGWIHYRQLQCTINGCLGTKTGSERFRIAVFVKWVFEWFHLVWQDSCKDSISLRTIWFVAVKLPQTHKQLFPVV